MKNNTSNPVTVKGAGTDSQNQVRFTKVLFLIKPCDDSHYSDTTSSFCEIPNFQNKPREMVEKVFKKLYIKYFEDEFIQIEFREEEITKLSKHLLKFNEFENIIEVGFNENISVYLRDAVYIMGKLFVDLPICVSDVLEN